MSYSVPMFTLGELIRKVLPKGTKYVKLFELPDIEVVT
jgi:hypothetical protein